MHKRLSNTTQITLKQTKNMHSSNLQDKMNGFNQFNVAIDFATWSNTNATFTLVQTSAYIFLLEHVLNFKSIVAPLISNLSHWTFSLKREAIHSFNVTDSLHYNQFNEGINRLNSESQVICSFHLWLPLFFIHHLGERQRYKEHASSSNEKQPCRFRHGEEKGWITTPLP